MNEEEQVLFAQWLAKKIGAKTEEEFKTAIEQLGEDGVKEAYSMFQEENSAGQTDLFKQGGKFSYIDCLKKYKTGNKIDCGCGKKKVVKAQGGLAAIGKAVAKAPGLAKVTAKAPTLGQKLTVGASNLKRDMQSVQGIANTVGKVGSAVKGVAGLVKGPSAKPSNQVITPSVTNNYYGANAGAIESPTMRPMPRQVPVFTGNDIPYGGITNTNPVAKRFEEGGILYAQRGYKLRGKALKGYAEGANMNETLRKLHRADRIENRQDARAERRITRRNDALVDEFNYQGEEVSPGVFQRERNKFDVANEANIRARMPLDGGDAGRGKYQVSFPQAIMDRPRPTAIAPVSTVKQLPADYNKEEVFNAAADQAFTKKPELVSPASTTKAVKVNPANIRGAQSSDPNQVGSGKQIRVPNEQYPGSTTIMPGNGIGDVDVVAKLPAGKQAFLPNGLPVINLPQRPADMENTPVSPVKVNPANIKGGATKTTAKPAQAAPVVNTPTTKVNGGNSIQVWAANYAKAKSSGDKIGMRHWQDLLETAGGEGRQKK